MRKKKVIAFYKNILFDEPRLKELNSILERHSDDVSFSAKTKDKSELKFDSIDELVSYENCKNERIASIKAFCYKRELSSHSIVAYFPSEIGKETASIEYEFANTDDESIFLSEIMKLLKKSVECNTISTILDIVFLIIFFISGFIYAFYRFKNSLSVNSGEHIFPYLALSLVCYIFFSKYVLQYFFPRVVFLVGEEIKRYEDIKRLRKGFFSTVLGILSGLVVNYFWQLLHK